MDLTEIEKTVCFTGHRPNMLGGYDDNHPLNLAVKEALRDEVTKAVEDGYTTFISGGALGVDQWAARIVLEEGHRLLIARPFPDMHARWPASSQAVFFQLLSEVGEARVIDVSENPYAAWKMQVRNRWMVDKSGRVIAVFSGASGGTANCLTYARQKERDLRIIDPKSLQVE